MKELLVRLLGNKAVMTVALIFVLCLLITFAFSSLAEYWMPSSVDCTFFGSFIRLFAIGFMIWVFALIGERLSDL